MTRKNALVIGATAGIGRQTARLLAQEGYFVVAVGRNQEAGDGLAGELGGLFIRADVSLMSEVGRVAQRVQEQLPSLDLIVHCADVLRTKRLETGESLEVSIATNYYGRFLLNHLLLNQPPYYQPARIIHVAAAGFPPGKNFRAKFPPAADAGGFTSHNLGQVANDFYGLALADTLQHKGTKVNILNPGIVDTNIRRNGQFPKWVRIIEPLINLLLKAITTTADEYARLVVAIATGGNSDANRWVLINRKGKPIKPSAPLLDKELQQYVWAQTEQIVGIRSPSVAHPSSNIP